MHRRRAAAVATALLTTAAGLSLAGCGEHTITIRFDPAVGDTYHLRSDVVIEVSRTVDDETTRDDATSTLDARETVVAVTDDSTEVEVTVARDDAAPRTYEVSLDPSGGLSTIDLVEGVPTDALGLELATGLPADIASPPAGPLAPGATWTIDRAIVSPDGGDPVAVTGTGRLASLGVVDGHDVAVVVTALRVPLRSVTSTADGLVTVHGTQTVASRTTYDLDDGTARTDRTEIAGDATVVVEPPAGIVAPPVTGSIRYSVDIDTNRIRAS